MNSRDFESIAPSFLIAKNRWPDAPNLQAHYNDLVQSYNSDSSGTIELCKSFLETICLTILSELGYKIDSKKTTTNLVVHTLDKLGLKNTRGSCSFDKVLSAVYKITDAITEVRNTDGSVAHGKDGYIDTISDNHLRFYILSIDTVLSLIIRAYSGADPNILKTREPYSRYAHMNSKIDAHTQIDARVYDDSVFELTFLSGSLDEPFNIRVTPSELLYNIDRQAYLDVFSALKDVEITEEVDLSDQDEFLQHDNKDIWKIAHGSKVDAIVTGKPLLEYKGKYEDLIKPFYYFLAHNPAMSKVKKKDLSLLTNTLLKSMEDLAVVDWSTRDSTRKSVKLQIKKLARKYSIDAITDETLDIIVDWLSQHINEEN